MPTNVIAYGPYATLTLLAAAMAGANITLPVLSPVVSPSGSIIWYGAGYKA